MTKKQSIINSAIELFAKQGIEATSVQQITTHCGISKGAFYLSFKSKDELILAIIDYFMSSVVIHVDQSVRNEKVTDNLFKIYFQKSLEAIMMHNGLAAIFMKEPLHYMGDEILAKLQYYDSFNDETIRYILLARYGERIKPLLYDLPYTVKGLFQAYSIILFSDNPPTNFEALSTNLAEKAHILATYSTQPFIQSSIQQLSCISKASILQELEGLKANEEDPFVAESVSILIDQFSIAHYSEPIVRGMMANVQNRPEYNWCMYLIQQFLHHH